MEVEKEKEKKEEEEVGQNIDEEEKMEIEEEDGDGVGLEFGLGVGVVVDGASDISSDEEDLLNYPRTNQTNYNNNNNTTTTTTTPADQQEDKVDENLLMMMETDQVRDQSITTLPSSSQNNQDKNLENDGPVIPTPVDPKPEESSQEKEKEKEGGQVIKDHQSAPTVLVSVDDDDGHENEEEKEKKKNNNEKVDEIIEEEEEEEEEAKELEAEEVVDNDEKLIPGEIEVEELVENQDLMMMMGQKKKIKKTIKDEDDNGLVVVLSDDDDDVAEVLLEQENKKVVVNNKSIISSIDPVPAKKMKRVKKSSSNGGGLPKSKTCLNLECEGQLGLGGGGGGGTVLDLLFAPSYALTYYGISINQKKNHRICSKCLQVVEKFMAESKEALENKEPLYGLTPFVPNKVLFSIDIDEDSDESEESEMMSHSEDVEKLISELNEKLDLKGQVKRCEDLLTKEADQLEIFFNDIDKSFTQTDDLIEAIRKEYCDLCDPKYETVMMKAVEIDNEGDLVFSEPEPNNYISRRVQNKRNLRPADVKYSPTKYNGVRDDEVMEVIPAASYKSTKQSSSTTKHIVLLPTPKQIPRLKPKINDLVYAMQSSQLSHWVKATIIEISTNQFSGGHDEFVVQWERDISRERKRERDRALGSGVGSGGIGVGRETLSKRVTGKHIAYDVPCPFLLPVGTRIIGKFIDEFNVAPSGNQSFYAGVVAEPPKQTNDHRYLIFFDDGYAQYISPDDVLLVCETSKEVWQDIHPDSQEFIKDYVQKYPERPMVRLQKGTVVTTEWNGKWWIARVNEVDCSLVKMHFEADNRYEWIYRGSTRLSPLYNDLKRKAASSNSRTQKPTARRHITQRPPSSKNLTIEYQYTEDDFPQTEQKVRQVSKKSTGAVQRQIEEAYQPYAAQSKKVRLNQNSYANLIEYEGRMYRPTIPKDAPQPKEYILHNCGPDCVIRFNDTTKDKDLPRPNPLALPLFLGWVREIVKAPKRTIFYRAPCGRRLRDPKELMKFLNVTNFNLGVDYFSFDFVVDCLGEFKPNRNLYSLKDLSYGKENMPISCANSLDNDYPEYVEYTTTRLPGKNVHLNLEDEFLCGCDCTDNCEDKSKCFCWQSTIENTAIGNNGKKNPNVGYQYRRLYDHILTGIYECNKMCKCKQTCVNRVAQFPLRSPLQVFKTSTKGWGIRPLYDVPHGAFICVYAGQLLTEQGANEDGTQYGDEYLAELDYIEVVEGLKEGYEEDALEPEQMVDKAEEEFVDFAETTRKNVDEDDRGSDEEESVRKPNKFSANNMDQNNGKSVGEGSSESRLSTRELFGSEELCYIMDAKSIGNIGRYLNHSCKPNVFVQNVFVDTHDLRFPWVAFFAFKHIRAGTELTWDYNYEIGSVPGKKMYCFCGTPECRGRLL